MDNAQKAIMIGVGLFITIIIIAAVMLITGIGTSLVNKGTNKAGNVAAQLDQTELDQYDNTKMSGAQVLSAVKKYWTDSNMIVYVGTNCTTPNSLTTGPATTPAGPVITNSSQGAAGEYSTVGNAKYISPSKQYTATIIKINDVAVGIYFK